MCKYLIKYLIRHNNMQCVYLLAYNMFTDLFRYDIITFYIYISAEEYSADSSLFSNMYTTYISMFVYQSLIVFTY